MARPSQKITIFKVSGDITKKVILILRRWDGGWKDFKIQKSSLPDENLIIASGTDSQLNGLAKLLAKENIHEEKGSRVG